MARIPQTELEQLKSTIDLAALVRMKGVTLQTHGKDLIGLCPFHNDTNESLIVTPSKNLWNCLGACNTGGDVIEWVKKAEGVSFRHAVEILRNGNGSIPKTSDKIVKYKTVRHLPAPVDMSTDDQTLLQQVIDYYHDRLKQVPEALSYCTKRGITSEEALTTFKLGFADRTLGIRLPNAQRKAGKEVREQLMNLGILRKTGHEHFNGCLVFPIMNEQGFITEVYGRKINNKLRPGTAYHLYLPGPHKGIWNPQALKHGTILLCESLIDALTFWCNGFRNVTTSYGIAGFTDEMLTAFIEYKISTVHIAYDRDAAGDAAAESLAKKLISEGMECYRITFPRGMDANSYACKVTPSAQSLKILINSATWMGKGTKNHQSDAASDAVSPLAAEKEATKEEKVSEKQDKLSVPTEIQGEFIEITLGDRLYRILGLSKNMTFGYLKVNIRTMMDDRFHIDTLDLYSHRARSAYIRTASDELTVDQDIIKRDMGRVLLKLEELQEQQIKKAMKPVKKEIKISEYDREQALTYLKRSNLIECVVKDFERCGVVGESTNTLVGYLACVSRNLEKPLGIIIQSSSAAGKTYLMESLLSFIPKEGWKKYSAMTGQSLFYMGENDFKYKVLAIVEEEGAERASYPLKLLQSEGELTIASTGKDSSTGKLMTYEYHLEGPVVIIITTTSIEIDEELQNRCIILTVNEDRDQTKAIHTLQRELETLEGHRIQEEWDAIRTVHQNAQRLLRPLKIINPYARALTFLDTKTRTRRDHMKYLTLIKSITLLHQYQRPVKTDSHGNRSFKYIEVTLEDIEVANGLACEVLGRSLDELPPQTRRLLNKIFEMVTSVCKAQQLEQSDYRFTRKTVRDYTGWGNTQLKIHLHRLEELEYLLVHQGSRGRQFVYELLYKGEGEDGDPFLMGLIDVEKLRKDPQNYTYESNKSGVN